MDKDAYVELVKEIRAMLAADAGRACPCPKTSCEWHGDCASCVRIHRHFGDHVPNCLQPLLKDKIQALAGVAEMTCRDKPQTPPEFWDHVNRVAPPDEAE